MISITLEAGDCDELVQRLEKTLNIMGKKVGAPSAVANFTFDDIIELCDRYDAATDRDSLEVVRAVAGTSLLRNTPLSKFADIVRALNKGIEDHIIAEFSEHP